MCPLNSYSSNPRALWASCYPVEACRTEILLIVDCAGRQTVGLVVSTGLNRHSPDCRLFWGIFRPVEARCKEIQSVAGCAGGQIVGLAAAKGWSASRGLHQGTPRPSSPATFAPVAPHAGAGGARSRAISDRISANSPAGHRDLGELERDVSAVTDDLRADFDQLFAQAGH